MPNNVEYLDLAQKGERPLNVGKVGPREDQYSKSVIGHHFYDRNPTF